MATIGYLLSTYWENFMHLAWIYAKLSFLEIPTIADPAHVSDVMYVLHFIQVTKPIISSQIICFQVEQTNNIRCTRCFYLYSEHFSWTN